MRSIPSGSRISATRHSEIVLEPEYFVSRPHGTARASERCADSPCRRFLFFLAADLPIAILWVCVATYPALPVYWKLISLATPLCTRWKTVLDSRSRLRTRKLHQLISASSKVLSVDGRLRLVRIPHGDWWIPTCPARHQLLRRRQDWRAARHGGCLLFLRGAVFKNAQFLGRSRLQPGKTKALRSSLARECRAEGVGGLRSVGDTDDVEAGCPGAGDSGVRVLHHQRLAG